MGSTDARRRVTAVTFGFAYLFGYALATGPPMRDGVGVREAHVGDPPFRSALAFSPSAGLLVAWPVDVSVVDHGIEEVSDPSAMDGTVSGND